jgi:Tfp pilus assembly major pilin PilA
MKATMNDVNAFSLWGFYWASRKHGISLNPDGEPATAEFRFTPIIAIAIREISLQSQERIKTKSTVLTKHFTKRIRSYSRKAGF